MRAFSILLFALAACGGGTKQTTPVTASPHPDPVRPPTPVPTPSGLLPTDPALVTGKLPNGLTYYIRKNAKPEKRVELWLAVNAGSVLEDDDQRGVAHFVEHMAFNGTKKYAKQEIVSWLEKIGMRFGADVNARTTFDETVFQLEVPTDDPALIEHGLDVLHEWAGSVSFEPDRVDKERGVILEERRLGRGVQGRMLDALIPAALPGSKYGERMPIGLEHIIQTVTPETLKRFYRDWYRPDLMAVIAVGDIDPAKLAAAIQNHFGDLVAPSPARPRPIVDVPPQPKTVTLVLQDPELPLTGVGVASKQPHRAIRTEDDVRASLADQLFIAMLNERLEELTKQATTPLMLAAVGKQAILRPIDVWFQGGAVKGDRVTDALGAIAGELARVAKLGFVDTEIARAKQSLLHRLDAEAKERDKTPSRTYVEDIVHSYLTGDTVTSIDTDLAYAQKLVPAITAAELQAVATRASSDENRLVVAAGNSKTTLPDAAALTAAIAAARAQVTGVYVDDVAAGPLVATPPTAGTIKSERTLADLGVTEWTLSNGVRVVLKPTDFQNDRLLLTGFSPGGTSLASDADYVAASHASAIAVASGAGQLSAQQLVKALSGSGVELRVTMQELIQVIHGSGPPDHLEQLFQLAYLRLAAPRKDDAAVAAWRDQEIQTRKNQLADPATVFAAKFDEIASGHHPRHRLLTGDDFTKLDVDRARAFYRDRFGHVAGMTFVIVGSFTLNAIKPLVLSYLGGLAAGKPDAWRDIKMVGPKGAVSFEVKQGLEPKAQIHLVYRTAEAWSRPAEVQLHALADALAIRLREELREGMGGTYGVRVAPSFEREPKALAYVDIEFGCAPEHVDALVKAALAIIADFQKSGPPAEVIDKIHEAMRRERETALKTNDYWATHLVTSYFHHDDPAHILTDAALIETITVASAKAAAVRYLGKDHILGVLRPAAAPTP